MIQTGLHHSDVLYRNNDLLGVNKPAGVPVHGSKILEGTPHTLLSMVRGEEGRLMHAAHRLDRPVSGVMLFTGNRELLAQLGRLFEEGRMQKRYIAVARGWTESEGEISYPLLPPKDVRKSGSVAREAVTRFERIARVEIPVPVSPYQTARYSLLGLHPQTGRRHQLRMHMKHISHPLIGDTTYGRGEHNQVFRENFECRRLLLHAWSLEFFHPADGEQVRIQAPLDADFNRVVDAFDWGAALQGWETRTNP
jgi:tRNA pseudouridine65 synthase